MDTERTLRPRAPPRASGEGTQPASRPKCRHLSPFWRRPLVLQMAKVPEWEPGRPSTPAPGHFLLGRGEAWAAPRARGCRACAVRGPKDATATPRPPESSWRHSGASAARQTPKASPNATFPSHPFPGSPHLPAGAAALSRLTQRSFGAVPPRERPNLVPQALSESRALAHRFPPFRPAHAHTRLCARPSSVPAVRTIEGCAVPFYPTVCTAHASDNDSQHPSSAHGKHPALPLLSSPPPLVGPHHPHPPMFPLSKREPFETGRGPVTREKNTQEVTMKEAVGGRSLARGVPWG